ncbi:unnamed protein product [Cyprideis torosa]|uniref:proteasome endopeptidase complex n=1 Tax=Cyprideis torosa TaxID=163714 RepID=A0A7R8W7H0_9CRUS|nr:unnamed protein product [Cyprideis torosa]CAG0887565.1 unnamed protein product [Cyprideis torosa]
MALEALCGVSRKSSWIDHDEMAFTELREHNQHLAGDLTMLHLPMLGGGSYIGSQHVKKLIPINDFLVGTMAGGAADCVYWERVLSKQCRLHELRNKERISVAAASKLLSNMVYNYKGMGLSLGVMIAGWDKKGPGLYYVDDGGLRTPGKLFSVGSGSIFAYGVLDAGYKWDLTDDEAYELGRRAIYTATFRDAASGGIVRVCHITEQGYKFITEEDCMDLHYKYAELKEAEDNLVR